MQDCSTREIWGWMAPGKSLPRQVPQFLTSRFGEQQ